MEMLRRSCRKILRACTGMKTDVPKIAKSTGYSEEQIQEIKNFIFLDKAWLGGPEPEYFAPDYMMAESWKTD